MIKIIAVLSVVVVLAVVVILVVRSYAKNNESHTSSADPAEWPSVSFDELGSTALGESIMSSDQETVDRLVNQMSHDDLNKLDRRGRNYVYLAVIMLEDIQMVKSLIQSGVYPANYDRYSEEHVLDHAFNHDDKEMVNLLLSLPEMNYRPRGNLLHFASFRGASEAITVIARRDDFTVEWLEEADPNGYRPLHAAVYTGSPEVVQALLELGANVNGLDKNGDTAIILAAIHGRKSIVEMLIAAGSSLDHKGSGGKTARDYLSE